MVGPLAAAAAIYVFGYSPLFVILALVSVATFIVSERLGVQRAFSDEDTRKSILPSNLLRTLKQRGFSNFYALNFLYSLLFPILLSYGGIFAKSKFNVGAVEILAIFSVVFLISSGLRVIFSHSRIRDFRALLLIGFSSLFASFFLMATTNYFLLFLLGFILFSIPHALIFPITTFMAIESAGMEALISSTYIFATSSGIAEFISPLLAVPIIAIYNFSAVFLSMAPVAVVGVILTLTIPNFAVFFSRPT